MIQTNNSDYTFKVRGGGGRLISSCVITVLYYSLLPTSKQNLQGSGKVPPSGFQGMEAGDVVRDAHVVELSKLRGSRS